MNLKKGKSIILFFLTFLITSCNKDFYSVGIELFDDQFKEIKSIVFPVFSYQESFEKVQTNNLLNVQLGLYKDGFFGNFNSSFISQLDISSFQYFGDYSQKEENEGAEIRAINEDEQLTAVYLDLPFFNNTNDSDNDGVIDILDSDPNDPNSDSDNDGLSDIIENQAGTNPLSIDTDNDGIIDPDDNEITEGVYDLQSQFYEIDSIFGNRSANFDIKVYELTYFLNSLDPNNNFETFKEYYSNDDYYDQGFFGHEFFNEKVVLNYNEIPILYKDDDPLTEDVDETGKVNFYETPRIRLKLDTRFFQRIFINNEGEDVLNDQNIFNDLFNGFIIKADNYSDDIYMLLDILNAKIVLEYDYNVYNTNATDDVSDDFIERKSKSNSIPFGGVTINLFSYNNVNQNILDEVKSSEKNIASKRIYLNGSNFISKLKLFSDDNSFSSDFLSFKSKDVIINEANLVFYIDNEIHESNYQYLPKRLYIYSFDSGEPIIDYEKDFSVNYQSNKPNSDKFLFGGLLQYDSQNKPVSYKFNITNHVSNIIRHDSVNNDLGITLTSDIDNSFLRTGFLTNLKKIKIPDASISAPFPVALFGSNENVDLSKKLKLEIFYTEY